ncbi:hypothetical protein D9M70_526840 [compost metagenome]
MLDGVTHHAADVLAQPTGEVQVTILFGALQRHQQVAHLQVGNTPIPQGRKQVLLHPRQDLRRMVLRPLARACGVPLQSNRLERVRRSSQHLGLLALGVLNGVDPMGQELQGLGASVARRLEP